MFLPRKLQKRKHAGRSSAQADGASGSKAAVHEARDDDVDGPKSAGEAVLRDDAGTDRSTSASTSTNEHSQAQASSPAPSSTTETAKLDRLVEFLYTRLSPLAPQQSQQSLSDLFRTTTTQNQTPTLHTTHLARLLTCIPGLATRCKSITLLAQALHTLASGAARNWFTLHRETFLVEWSGGYVRAVRDLASLNSEGLAPLLVYVESIPPRVRTRAQAASYLHGAMGGSGVMVLAVLEPGVVDLAMAGSEGEWRVDGGWTSGRAFFVLDGPEGVDALCRAYPWELEKRSDAKGEPIRCLSWDGWREMREVYLRQLQHGQLAASNGDAARVDGTDHREPAKRNPTDADVDSTAPWYRGTILVLPLATTSAALPLPTFTRSQLTPAFLNRHLKPQLEQRVPESVSYIHPLPPADSFNSDTKVAIRTAHASLATRLLTHFPDLVPMVAAQEDAYWTALPEKTRTAARRRALALDTH